MIAYIIGKFYEIQVIHSESHRAWIIKSVSPNEPFNALGMTLYTAKMGQEVESRFE